MKHKKYNKIESYKKTNPYLNIKQNIAFGFKIKPKTYVLIKKIAYRCYLPVLTGFGNT